MKLAQRLWRRWVQFPYWALRCLWLQANGRLYYMRNAPTWFVRFVGQFPLDEDEHDFHMRQLIGEARQEAQLRRSRPRPSTR